MQITASNWQVLSPLLDEALLLAPTARVTWLDGQAHLLPIQRAQLERLIALANAPETDTIFQNLPGLLGASSEAPSAAAARACGDIVGAYELLRPLGRGGMAEVWLARRSDGAYERDIALKLPLSHLPHNIAAERLLRERNVLASLEHPSIARFYDAGVAANGQPFLAMEYVEGESIVDYANARQLDLRARCKLMLHVLDALHYAHQHLVVHRDLKPSNILVRADGRVTLLDFGIAKVLESPDAATLATELTQVMGSAMTLAYAAPEQLLAEPVTTATDLYSAGVVMFELLTGARPFATAERSASALLLAMEGTAVPTRISSAREAKAKAHGCATAKAWQRAFQGDLAAICTRALRLEAADRYASALSMREDLTRYFDNRPVQARAGAWAYQWRKFFERNRVAVAVSTVTGATALALAAHAWQKTQDLRVSTARASAIEAVVKNMFDGMNPNNNATRTFTAKELLDRSRPLLMQAAAGSADAKSQTTLMMANLYSAVGAHTDATRLLEGEIADARALGDSRRELWAQCLLADVNTESGRDAQAYDAMRAALVQLTRGTNAQVKRDVLFAEIAYRLGSAAISLEKFDDASAALTDARSALATLNDQPVELVVNVLTKQAALARHRSDAFAAAKLLDDAQNKLQATEGMQLTKDTVAIQRLSVTISLGRYAEAITMAERMLRDFGVRYAADSQWLLATGLHYSYALIRVGKLREADEQIRSLIALGGPDPAIVFQARFLAAQVALFSGESSKAESALASLAQELPNAENTMTSGRIKRALALAQLQQGRTEEALQLLRRTEASQIAVANDPKNLDVAHTRILIGCALSRTGDWVGARAALTAARDALLPARGLSNYATLLTEAYLAMLPSPGVAGLTGTDQLAQRIQRELGWQFGASELATRLQNGSSSKPNSLPALL